ncbi:MAG: hypothetical protein ACXU9K_10300, partial [Thermodesulfobacteriota bacterium]
HAGLTIAMHPSRAPRMLLPEYSILAWCFPPCISPIPNLPIFILTRVKNEEIDSFDPFGGDKPRLSGRDIEAPLRVNPEPVDGLTYNLSDFHTFQ